MTQTQQELSDALKSADLSPFVYGNDHWLLLDSIAINYWPCKDGVVLAAYGLMGVMTTTVVDRVDKLGEYSGLRNYLANNIRTQLMEACKLKAAQSTLATDTPGTAAHDGGK